VTAGGPIETADAAERESIERAIRWVRSGMPSCGLTKRQRRDARRFVIGLARSWRQIRDERLFEEAGCESFEEYMRGRYGLRLADAEAVIRSAGRPGRRRHG
jgi:hypothetical protein